MKTLKKSWLYLLMCLVAVFCCGVFLVGCGDKNSANGIYYEYNNGKYDKTSYFELDGGKWVDDEGIEGTYKVSNGKIVFTSNLEGETIELFEATISKGTICVDVMGEKIYYCQEGKTPSGIDDKKDMKLTVKDATITSDKILMVVNSGTTSVSLADKVTCEKNCFWKLYYDKLGQTEIPTKIAASMSGELLDGDNIFYIVVSSASESKVDVYELNVYRSYAVTVSYYDGLDFLKSETAYTGYEFMTNYVPEITGYTFNDWNYEPEILWDDLKLYADKTAKSYTVRFNANGGEFSLTEKAVTYDSEYSLGKPKKQGYDFRGWYYEETELTDENGDSLSVWKHDKDITVRARWEVKKVNISVQSADSKAGTVSGGGQYDYGSHITLKAKVNEGYVFIGWYKCDNQGGSDEELVSQEPSYSFTIDYVRYTYYTAKWSRITVKADIKNAGTISTNKNNYVLGEEVTIKAETYKGYTWLGWYKGFQLVTEETNYTFTVGTEDVAYTAKWQVWDELKDYYFTSDFETCSITGLKNKNVKEIVIPSCVTKIGYNAFQNCSSLTSVEIPDSVTSIGYYAFADCSSLTSIEIPGSITSIGNYAFKSCVGLTEVIIPDSVTSIGEEVFAGCSSLTSVVIGNGVTSIGKEAFSGCDSLTSVVIPDSVTSIGGGAFKNCTALTDIEIPGSITSIGNNAFESCVGLTEVVIPDSVISIGDNTFYNCCNLIRVTCPTMVISTLPKSNVEIVVLTSGESIERKAFSDFVSLKEITIPDSITNIDYNAFYNCHNITKVTCPISALSSFPKSRLEIAILTSGESIDNSGFWYCTSLTSIVIPDSVTSIGDSAFEGCSSLTEIVIPDSVTSIGAEAFYKCESLTSVVIGDSVTSIGNSVFSKCSSLTSIEIPNGVMSIGNYAFFGCNSLKSVTIGDSVMSIGEEAFKDCENLTGVYITDMAAWCNISFNSSRSNPLYYAHNLYLNDELVTELIIPDIVTSINDGVFSDCDSLTSVVIPDSVTSIGNNAFAGCSSLTSVIIPDSVTSIGDYAFRDCDNLTGIYITDMVAWCNITFDNFYSNPMCYAHGLYLNGELVTEIVIPDSVTSIGDYAFAVCSSLASVEIPDSVTSIGDYAFAVCSSLASVEIPDSVTSIGYRAFYKCESLTSIEIPGSITSIGNNAFESCVGLTEVVIPDSVISIGDNTFYNCCNLIRVTCPTMVISVLPKSNVEIVVLTSGESIDNKEFLNCTSLTSVVIGDSVTSIGASAFEGCSSLTSVVIPESVTSIGDCAFWGCSSLTSVEIPDGVTSIGRGVFILCSSLTSVKIPDGVTSIGDNAFAGCRSLTSVVIPDRVTSIGYGAFGGCSMASIVIPDSVTSIGEEAFGGCSSLTSITFEGTVEQWNALTKGKKWNYEVPATEVVCSNGTVAIE